MTQDKMKWCNSPICKVCNIIENKESKLEPEQDFIDTAGVFWLVWCPQGTTPKHRHETRESAETEAERLAQKDHRRDFYVVKAQSLYKAEVLIKNTVFE